MNNSIIIIIFVCVICVSVSISLGIGVGIFLNTKDNSDSDSKNAKSDPENDPVPVTLPNLVPVALPKKEDLVPGYYNGIPGIIGPDWGENNMSGKETAESCQIWAKSKNYPMYGYRNNTHPEQKWRNTCFGYNKPGIYTGDNNDKVHSVGCTDTTLSVLGGCQGLVPGFYTSDLGENYMTGEETPNSCLIWAKSKNYPMYGYRNNTHPEYSYQNTCFGYTKANVYGGNNNDKVHYVGCTDINKSVNKGCV